MQAKKNVAGVVLAVFAGALVAALIFPLLGLAVGVIVAVLAGSYLFVPAARPVFNRVLRMDGWSAMKRYAAATGIACAGASMTCAGVSSLSWKEQKKRAVVEEARRAEEKRVQDEEKIGIEVETARAALQEGNLDVARERVEAANRIRAGRADVAAMEAELEIAERERDQVRLLELLDLNQAVTRKRRLAHGHAPRDGARPHSSLGLVAVSQVFGAYSLSILRWRLAEV